MFAFLFDCALSLKKEQKNIFVVRSISVITFESDNMGAEQSAPEQPIYPQPTKICASEQRFCLPHTVQLHLREKFFSMSGDDFKITDAHNKAIIYFQCEGRSFSLSEKKVLRDNVGVPVLNMKEKLFR